MHSDRGAVLVLVAAGLPVFLGFFAWILDFGNASVHRRHLQTQADAAVLAAAQQIGSLSNCDETAVEQRAFQFAGAFEYSGGVAGVTEPLRNVPRQQDAHAVINDLTYFNQPDKVDPTFPADKDDLGPCEARMIDVKTTQQDVPRFIPTLPGFTFGPTLDFINAHARVQFETVSEATGQLPVAVPESRPKKARVQFIDATTGAVIATTDLAEGSSQDGLGIWSNSATPVSVPVSTNVRVRVTLSGGPSLTCGDPLVTCYDATDPDAGLSYIRTHPTPGAATAVPQVGDVTLTSGTCPEAYFVTAGAACTIGVRADVTTTDANLQMFAVLGGQEYPMTKAGSIYTAGGMTVSDVAGEKNVTFRYRLSTCAGNANQCKVSLAGTQQRTYRGSDERSGPIRLVRLSENGVAGANSFPRCAGCARDLVVTIGIEGSLQLSQAGDPAVALRITGSGSRTQALDCDPALPNLRDELREGCGPTYVENAGTACPQSVQSTPQPWDCVDVQTGAATNQIPSGLNERILGEAQPASCTSPNNYPVISVGDPRILTVFLVPFGAFDASGGGSVPIAGFASFYVTGWTGQGGGFTNPCAADAGGTDDPPPDSSAGWMVGHFIDYVVPGGGNGSGEECPQTGAPSLCVAVLTE